jgi:RHS repeat-associated protein
VVETAGTVTRTTTDSYDAAGRLTGASVVGGLGDSVPSTTTNYASDTGEVSTISSNGNEIGYSYDALGREVAYSDGSGNTATTTYDALDRPVRTTDSASSLTTYSYDTKQDPRGLETSRTTDAGTVAASYDADGDISTESLPGGYTLTVTQDPTDNQTAKVYTRDSDHTVVAADYTNQSIHDQTVDDADTAGQTRTLTYTYDAAGRLTQADDASPDGTCSRRAYALDANSNRVGLATSTSAPSAGCTSSGATATTYVYDSADRLESTGTTYDAFGRTIVQAAGATSDYYTNDLIRQQTYGSSRQTWGLDAAGRLASTTVESKSGDNWTQTASETNHYDDDSDNPSWVQSSDGAINHYVAGIDGSLTAITGAAGDIVLQLSDIHGDITVQLPLDTEKAPIASSYDEFGNQEAGPGAARYGWLGSQQRSSETPTGSILMGVRLYDPAAGRFLSVDPVMEGSANAYDYCNGDPVNCYDINGRFAAVAALGFFEAADWWNPLGWIVAGLAVLGITTYAVYKGSQWVVHHHGHTAKSVPSNSSYWKSLKPYKGKTRTNGKRGSKKRYFEWDYTHGDIEVYDHNGHHLGSADPEDGHIYKPAVKGRKIKV